MMRLDKWLKQKYPGLSGRQIEEAIVHRLVIGDAGETLKKGGKIEALPNCKPLDDHLLVLKSGSENKDKRWEAISVIKEESGFSVIDKPAGIPSHPLSLFDTHTVTHWAFAKYPEARLEFEAEIQPTLCPHRLDTDTSGALIVCFTRTSFEKWRLWFKQKQIVKTYLAWCWGSPKAGEWVEDLPLAHSVNDPRKMVSLGTKNIRYRASPMSAETSFRVIRTLKDKFLVEATMRTGVTHQVRVHLANAGAPLIGDGLYDLKFDKRVQNKKGHLLRAFRIERMNRKQVEWSVELNTTDFRNYF